eukprot:TRINITY_DN12983_c0_g1_i1.p2 TRINITY_DN12983_c0_g1~~TRINITY_DN12983_c0_g1_i1.p2  ORF type:complete len:197 (+),score=49.48 TRINITY_DN12983_c0_g1_i1:40-591(+)
MKAFSRKHGASSGSSKGNSSRSGRTSKDGPNPTPNPKAAPTTGLSPRAGRPEPPVPPASSDSSPKAAPLGAAISDFDRRFSDVSLQTMQTLEQLAKELGVLEARAAEIVHDDPAAMDNVAMLFGTVQKLLEHRIDAVSTVDLQTGKQEARDGRKDLVNRANELLDQLAAMKARILAARDSPPQ